MKWAKPNINIKNDNLYTYGWPGNVRELNLVERLSILSANESTENIDKQMNDILSASNTNSKYKNLIINHSLLP